MNAIELRTEIETQINQRGGRYLSSIKDDDPWKEAAKNLEDHINIILNERREDLYISKVRSIEFCFTDRLSVDGFAYATKADGECGIDLVAISVGTFRKLNEAFQRMLSHPNVFPHYGDASKESSARSQGPFNDQALGSFNPTEPLDPSRKVLAEELTRISLYLLVFHEFGHILLGHADYIHKLRSDLSLQDELKKLNINPQAFELDADGEGISRLLEYYFELRYIIANNIQNSDNFSENALRYLLQTPNQVVQSLLFCTYIAFRIYDEKPLEKFPSLSSHPPFRLRLFLALGKFRRLCEINQFIIQYDLDRLDMDMLIILGEAEKCIADLKDETVDFKGFHSLILDGSERTALEEYTLHLEPSAAYLHATTRPLARRWIPEERANPPAPTYAKIPELLLAQLKADSRPDN